MFVLDPYIFSAMASTSWTAWDGSADGLVTLIDGTHTSARGVSCAKLDTDKIIATYFSAGRFYAVILTISGTSISVSTPVFIATADINKSGLDIVDATRAIFVYTSDGNFRGNAVVLSVSGTTITVNSSIFLNGDATGSVTVKVVDTNKCVIVYSSTSLLAAVMTISGTTVNAPGTPLTIAATAPVNSIAVLDSTHVIVSYRDGGSGAGKARTLLIGASTITVPSAAVQYDADTIDQVAVTAMGPSQAVTAYIDNGNGNQLTACVLNVSGTTTTAQTPVVMLSSVLNRLLSVVGNGICKINETQFMINYGGDSGTVGTFGVVGSIMSNIITRYSPVTLNSSNGESGNSNALLDANTICTVACMDDKAKAIILKRA